MVLDSEVLFQPSGIKFVVLINGEGRFETPYLLKFCLAIFGLIAQKALLKRTFSHIPEKRDTSSIHIANSVPWNLKAVYLPLRRVKFKTCINIEQ